MKDTRHPRDEEQQSAFQRVGPEQPALAVHSKALSQLFYDSAVDFAFVTLDMNNGIVDWSRGAERILGFEKAEAIGKTGNIFFTPEDIARGEVARELAVAQSEGRASDERWHMRKDGSRFWGSGLMIALRDESGTQQGFGKIFRDLTASKKLQDQIKASLREKDLLLREIHHRVKNNLYVVASLISMQARSTTHPEMRAVFQELQDRVRAIASLHETLYSSPDLASILFGDYMEQLLRELQSVHAFDTRRVKLAVEAADVVVNIEQALPLGLILNELVTNCFKHAFPDGRRGRIEICLRYVSTGDAGTIAECELIVKDDGIGMETTSIRDMSTTGLRIVEILTEQLNGSVVLSDQRTGGAQFTVRFPVQPEGQSSELRDISEIIGSHPAHNFSESGKTN